jgi:YD repeat-containing protein
VVGQSYVAAPATDAAASGPRVTASSPDEDPSGVAPGGSAAPSASAFAPLAAAASGPAPNVLVNAPGLGPSTGINPSDVGAAIGPEYFVQGVNATGVAVYRRSDLALVAGPVPGPSFANAPAGQEVLDAQFMWDEPAQRWFYSFTYKLGSGSTRTSGILYGWSKTADPTDLAHGWCQMRIDTGADFEDRPKLSTSASHIVLGTNVDPIAANWYSRIWTIPKPAGGSTTCPTSPQTGITAFGSPTQPLKSTDGNVVDSPVPAIASDGGATVYVVAADDDAASNNQIMVWHVGADGQLRADGNIGVNAYSKPPLAPQPSGYDSLDTIDQRLSNAVARTDPDAGATAVWTQQVIADPAGSGRSVIRWYELIPSSCGGGTCTAAARRQQGEVKDAATWLFNSAISPTGAGNEAVVHYNSASGSQLAQIRASSRVSSTPLGTMSAPVTIGTSDAPDQDFTCFDTRPGCRWGDYSTATPDPNDPHAVWGSSPVIGPAPPPDSGGKIAQHWKSRNFGLQADGDPALAHSGTGAADTAPGGDGDGVAEPGESLDVTETVRNGGGSAASGVTGTLQSLTQGLTVTGASASYPDIAPGGTGSGSGPFHVSAGASLACGVPLSMRLSLDTSKGRYRVPVTVTTGKAGPEQSTTATDVPKSIPDKSATGVSSSVTVAGTGTVANVDVSIARITHTWDGDLQIELTGPDGTKVVLADRPGGVNNPGDNFVGTVFSDSAATPLSSGAAPYTGTFKPQGGRLAAFAGKPVAGKWTLRVSDLAENDVGTLTGWGLRTSAAGCSADANVPPAASFTASADPVPTGTAITFTSTSTDSDGSVASQAWDLDDDGAFDDGTGATASRSFTKAGSYTVRLKATDNRGASSTASRTVSVTNRPPTAAFGSAPAAPSTGDPVTFTSSSEDPDGTIASQAWDLDNDGNFDNGTAATASRTFAKAGTYTVGLKVVDDNGGSATTTRQVSVGNRAPTAAFGAAPDPAPTGTSVTFSSTSTDQDGTIASQSWDLDNNGTFGDATGATASRTFAKAGTYTVALKVTDDGGTPATVSHTVTIRNRPPVASWTSAPAAPRTGDAVTFTATASDPDGTIASRAWDLDNDGNFDNGTAATASRTFAKAGSYTVGLKVTDDNGDSTTFTKQIAIANRVPTAAFGATPNPVATASTVTFTSSSSDPDGTIASQSWDLNGDGTFGDATGATASRSFPKAGPYVVRLKVTDDDGGSATIEHTVTATNRMPTAAFQISPNPTSPRQTVTFTSTSSDPDGTIASQAWDLNDDGKFDDGTGASASRSFSRPGTYKVWLKVTDDDGGSATLSRTVTISNRAPAALFSADPVAPSTGDPVTFTSASTDPDGPVASQSWDLDDDGQFDDGTGATASRSFAKSGSYTVRLQVVDPDGMSSVASEVLTVGGRPPVASFTVSPQSVITGQPATFDAIGSTDPDGSVVRYQWDLDGNGVYETDTLTNPKTSRFYGSPGNVVVGLLVTDDDGKVSSTQRTITVKPAPPFADHPNVPPPDDGLPGGNPGPNPDPQPRPTQKPPRGSLRVLSHNLRAALKRGLPLRFSSSQAATARFRITAGALKVGSLTKLVGAGRSSIRVKLTRKPRQRLTVKMTLIGVGSLSRTYTVKTLLR